MSAGGECEAAPLVSIASLICPMSHSACKPVIASVVGQDINDVGDIRRIGNLVRANSLDLLQADHTLSGIDIALWDLLGRRLNEPVGAAGYKTAYAKTPYASVLFGDTAAETLRKAKSISAQGFRAAKFGWGPFGLSTVEADCGSNSPQPAKDSAPMGFCWSMREPSGTRIWMPQRQTG